MQIVRGCSRIPTKSLLLDLKQFICNVVTSLYLRGGNKRQTNVYHTLKITCMNCALFLLC